MGGGGGGDGGAGHIFVQPLSSNEGHVFACEQ